MQIVPTTRRSKIICGGFWILAWCNVMAAFALYWLFGGEAWDKGYEKNGHYFLYHKENCRITGSCYIETTKQIWETSNWQAGSVLITFLIFIAAMIFFERKGELTYKKSA